MIPLSERIVYEDNHILIVNKLASELVQGDKTGDTCLIDDVKDYLKKKYNKPGNVFAGLVHRLDRPVSGAVIFARTSKALSRLNKMMQERSIKKVYWAVTANRPPKKEDEICCSLIKNEKMNKSFVCDDSRANAKVAKLGYKLINSSERYHLIEVILHTGRHHQIRAQLADLNCPIKGDLKYGFNRPNKNGSIHLHARYLSFLHPVSKQPLSIEAELPKDVIWELFK